MKLLWLFIAVFVLQSCSVTKMRYSSGWNLSIGTVNKNQSTPIKGRVQLKQTKANLGKRAIPSLKNSDTSIVTIGIPIKNVFHKQIKIKGYRRSIAVSKVRKEYNPKIHTEKPITKKQEVTGLLHDNAPRVSLFYSLIAILLAGLGLLSIGAIADTLFIASIICFLVSSVYLFIARYRRWRADCRRCFDEKGIYLLANFLNGILGIGVGMLLWYAFLTIIFP